jgi:hypothetical protein
MKYFTLFTLLLSFNSYAYYCGGKSINLNTTAEVSHDVIDFPNKVVFHFETESTGWDTTFPTVKVENHAGFECEVLSLKRVAAKYFQESKSTKRCYKLAVVWGPGADYSGCMLQIQGDNFSKEASLYMNY